MSYVLLETGGNLLLETGGDLLYENSFYQESLSDSISFSEAVAKQIGKIANDNATLTDIVTKSVQKTVFDALSALESSLPDLLLETGGFVLLEDGKTLLELESPSRNIIESIVSIDTISKQIHKILYDNPGFTESVQAVLNDQFLSDSMNFTDSVQVIVNETSLTDNASLSDIISVLWNHGRNVSDAISISDTLPRPLLNKVAFDSMSISDTVTKHVSKGITDPIQTQELVAKEIVKKALDSSTFAENLAKNIGEAVKENITVSESLKKYIVKVIQEVIAFVDSALASFSPKPQINITSYIYPDITFTSYVVPEIVLTTNLDQYII